MLSNVSQPFWIINFSWKYNAQRVTLTIHMLTKAKTSLIVVFLFCPFLSNLFVQYLVGHWTLTIHILNILFGIKTIQLDFWMRLLFYRVISTTQMMSVIFLWTSNAHILRSPYLFEYFPSSSNVDRCVPNDVFRRGLVIPLHWYL